MILASAATTYGQASPSHSAPVTSEQRRFVHEQLDRLKVTAGFADGKQVNPKSVVDALLAKGKPLLPALQEALPAYQGPAHDACARAILLLTWGFDPDEVIAKAISKEMKGKPLQQGVVPTPMTDPVVVRMLPNVKAYELSLDSDPPAGAGTLRMHNIVLLGHDGSATILSTPVAVANYFKLAHRPATQPATTPAAAVDENHVRDLLTAWLTLTALTASDAKQTFQIAPDTIKIFKNGARWVASARVVPSPEDPQKPAERQLLLVLSPDGAVLNATETTGLRPLKK